jgi:hypothetical protein
MPHLQIMEKPVIMCVFRFRSSWSMIHTCTFWRKVNDKPQLELTIISVVGSVAPTRRETGVGVPSSHTQHYPPPTPPTPPPPTTPPHLQYCPRQNKIHRESGGSVPACIRNSTPTLNINYHALLKIILWIKSNSQHKLSHTVRKNRLRMKSDFNINYPALLKITGIKRLYSNIHLSIWDSNFKFALLHHLKRTTAFFLNITKKFKNKNSKANCLKMASLRFLFVLFSKLNIFFLCKVPAICTVDFYPFQTLHHNENFRCGKWNENSQKWWNSLTVLLLFMRPVVY